MKKVFAETFPSGSIKTSVSSIVLVNNTAKTQDVSVPTDTCWCIETIKAANDDNVTRTVKIQVYLTSAKTILVADLGAYSVPTTQYAMTPNNDDVAFNYANNIQKLVLGAGMTISVTWNAGGASAGATDPDGLVILYRELPRT